MFPIPDQLLDFFNKIFRKKESLYTRQEHATDVEYEYETFMYRGVPIQVIKTVVVKYASSSPYETFTAIREGPEGTLVGSHKVISSNRI